MTDEVELVFAGFVAFLDPPKASAAAAIATLAASGVTVKILTGDNERVTRHVCGELGVQIGGVLTGEELSALSDEALLARLPSVNLFCRVTPQQKRRVLLALKRLKLVTGFLGDGINDAPRYMRPMSGSRSTVPPTLPKRRPIWSCSSTIWA